MGITRLGTRSSPLGQAGLVFAAFFFALFFGLASVFLPAWFVVSLLVMPAVLTLLLVRPEYALIVFVALVCGLVHPAFVPRVPFLGGSLAAADATLVILAIYAAWIFAESARKRNAAPVPGGELLAAAFISFLLILAASVVIALFFKNIEPPMVLGEARDLVYVIALPISMVILRQPERQERFVIGLVVLGCLFSIGQVLQGIFNIPIFGGSGISALETLGYREYSTTRSNTLGLNVIIFALFIIIGAYVLDVVRMSIFIPIAALLLTGILLTFGRTTFVVLAACVIVLVLWLNSRKLAPLIGLLLIFLFISFALAFLLNPASLDAVIFRMTSIGTEIAHGYSAKWRLLEAEAMLPHILRNPLTGIGLGAEYHGFGNSSVRPELDRYMHNAYLYMAGKMGLPALAAFLMIILFIFNIGRQSAKRGASPWIRVIGAAGAVMMIRIIFASVTEPHLMSDYGVIIIAIAGALVCLSAQRMQMAAARQRKPERV